MQLNLKNEDYEMMATGSVKPKYKYVNDQKTDETECWQLSGIAFNDETEKLCSNKTGRLIIKIPLEYDREILEQIKPRMIVKFSNVTATPYQQNGFVKVSLLVGEIEIGEQLK